MNSKEFTDIVFKDREILRGKKPLIHNITNFVVMNQTANVILSIGGSPVMSHSIDEVCEMVSNAGALVLNIGTLWDELVKAMVNAGKMANKKNIPVILDPVGVGATGLRRESTLEILKNVYVSVVRGNLAEIKNISGRGGNIKGVDSNEEESIDDIIEFATVSSKKYGNVFAITGKTDIITDGDRIFLSENGDQMLKYITGTGCSASVSCACFMAVQKDLCLATLEGLSYYSVAAEITGKESRNPGTFEIKLRDKLFNMKKEEFKRFVKIKQL